MKYIDADLLRKEIEKRTHICNGIFERDSDIYFQGKAVAYKETLSFINSLQQEQPEVDLEKEIEKELRLHYNDDQDVYWWNYLKNSFHHFYKLGRKQVLQEIYDGKTKPVDKITAAWLDDKEEDK